MAGDWFVLALCSALCLASADAFTKKFLSDYAGWELILIRFGVPGVMLLPMALLHPISLAPPALWGWMAALVPLELLAMMLYSLAIRDSPLSLTVPYLALTPVFNVLTGWAFLGETVSGPGLGGIVLVAGGSYLLNIEHLRSASGWDWFAPLRAIAAERGSRLMLVAAAIYSLTSVMSKRAMQLTTPEGFGAFYFATLGVAAIGVVAMSRPQALRVLRRNHLVHLLVGGVMAAMVITHFLALDRVEVAYMIAVKRTSLLFGILFGALFFGERRLGQHLLGGTLMVAGVVLILL